MSEFNANLLDTLSLRNLGLPLENKVLNIKVGILTFRVSNQRTFSEFC